MKLFLDLFASSFSKGYNINVLECFMRIERKKQGWYFLEDDQMGNLNGYPPLKGILNYF